MRKLFSFFSLFIFALLFCACSFLGDAQKTGSVSFCIGDGVYSKISASRAADENTEGEYYLQVSLNGGYSEEKTMPIHEHTIRAIMTFGDIPEGAEVWAYALIYEVFDGEKEYILEGTSEEITIAEGENALSITMTSYEEGGNERNSDLIGTKERPTAIGDIVFSDGSAVAYSVDLVLTEEQAASAVAVIFYAGGTDGLGSRILGVALKEDETGWAMTTADGYAGSGIMTDEYNGSVNWGRIYEACEDAQTTPSRYSAFRYANNYTATGFSTGWYLPAIYEVQELKTNVDVVNNAINKIKETRTNVSIVSTSGEYWSSTQGNSSGYALYLKFSETSSRQSVKEASKKVRPIHAF